MHLSTGAGAALAGIAPVRSDPIRRQAYHPRRPAVRDRPMNAPDLEFDPDDNFAHSFEDAADADDDSPEALVWQLLLLINPGDEAAALQQFADYQDALAEAGSDDAEPVWLLKDVIDWKSGFYVEDNDVEALIDSVTELAARWNLRIDWGVDDPGDDAAADEDSLAGTDVPALLAIAYDRLREDGYTLWVWNTSTGAAGEDAHAGWITLSRDDEAMQVLAPMLGIELRAASDVF